MEHGTWNIKNYKDILCSVFRVLCFVMPWFYDAGVDINYFL